MVSSVIYNTFSLNNLLRLVVRINSARFLRKTLISIIVALKSKAAICPHVLFDTQTTLKREFQPLLIFAKPLFLEINRSSLIAKRFQNKYIIPFLGGISSKVSYFGIPEQYLHVVVLRVFVNRLEGDNTHF